MSRGKSKKTQEEWDAIPFDDLSENRKRLVVLRHANYACTQCGFDKRRDDGHHVVEIDHIDGNHKNNSRENLRVLCPNCHSLTHNFRNYGRSSKEKSGTRFRPANYGYREAMDEIHRQEKDYEDFFKKTILDAHELGEIDFSKFGWVQRLCEKLHDMTPQQIGGRVRRLLPDFYVKNCFSRGRKRLA